MPTGGGGFDGSALKASAQVGAGLFVASSAIEAEVCRQHGVRLVGRLESVREQFYVITVERTLKHPAVVAISEIARHKLFRADVASRLRRS